MHRRRRLVIGGVHAGALAQSIAQGSGPPVLLEEIAEGLFGDVLQAPAGFEAELIERMPGLGIEFDAAAEGRLLHGAADSSCITAKARTVDGSATGYEGYPLAFRFGRAAGSAFLVGTALADLPLPVSPSTLRRSASIRLTTLAGRAAGFSLGAGRPSCFERIRAIIAFS